MKKICQHRGKKSLLWKGKFVMNDKILLPLNEFITNENCFIINLYLNSEDRGIRVRKMTNLLKFWRELLLWKGIVCHQWQDSPITKWVNSEREMFHRQHVSKQRGSRDSCEKDDKFVNIVERNHYCEKDLSNNDKILLSLNEFITNENCFIVNMYLNSEDRMIRVRKMTSLSISWQETIIVKGNCWSYHVYH